MSNIPWTNENFKGGAMSSSSLLRLRRLTINSSLPASPSEVSSSDYTSSLPTIENLAFNVRAFTDISLTLIDGYDTFILTFNAPIGSRPVITAVPDALDQWLFSVNSIASVGTSFTANITLRSGYPVTVTVTVNGAVSNTIYTTDVFCIAGWVQILTMRGSIAAKDIKEDDLFLQLYGTYSKVKKIRVSIPDESEEYYASPNERVVVTGWHPIRLRSESKYIVAKDHPYMHQYLGVESEVFHFELEDWKDDILFLEDSVIAESWNSLPHGVEVDRS